MFYPGSRIPKFFIPDPGGKKSPDHESWILDPTLHKKRDEKQNQTFSCSLWFQEQVLLVKNKRTKMIMVS
jgi:hypothetical protein